MVQCALAAIKSKKQPYFAIKYGRIKKRRGHKKAIIAIARMMYKDPMILIFDEATSSLDSISERYVKKALDSLSKQGKTIIVIAHRLSTVKTADNIVVLDQGKVAESGNHQSLLSKNGIYHRLWKEQFDEIDL